MRIAVVEDEQEQRDLLSGYIQKFAQETNTQHTVDLFENGLKLLEDFKPEYDIILLDIEMPGINGMETAEQIRALDENVVLMFITNMAQYAVGGYSVGALDFVLKPINYTTFSIRFSRAVKRAGLD